MKREAIGHTKMKRRCRRLGIPQYVGIGIMESAWHLTAREAQGATSSSCRMRTSRSRIEYRGDESKFIEALIASGWLDRDPVERLAITIGRPTPMTR
jgi:hypothetical protein